MTTSENTNSEFIMSVIAFCEAHSKELGGLLVIISGVFFYMMNQGELSAVLFTAQIPLADLCLSPRRIQDRATRFESRTDTSHPATSARPRRMALVHARGERGPLA